MARPVYLNHSPQPGFIGVQLDAPIFFRVEEGNGLNLSTFTVRVGGVFAILNGVYQSGFGGTIENENHIPTAISVLIIPSVHFTYSEVVTVASEIENNLAESGRDNYSFVTVSDPDTDIPIVTANPHGGLYNVAQTVTLTSNYPSAVIYYTLDGSDPVLTSPVYTTPILITGTTLKFLALDSANISSGVMTEIYEIDTTGPISKATPIGGNYFTSQQVVLSCDDSQAVIYYTTNGLVPTTSSSIYTTPIKVIDNGKTVIKFFAADKAGNQESVHVETYFIEIAKNNYQPTNVFVTCPFNRSELHIRWDDMHPIYNQVVGYNVYRADVEMGPYQKLNDGLIAITQYLDKTIDQEIIEEDVSEQFRRTVNISRQVNDSFSGHGLFDKTKWVENDPGDLLFQNEGAIFKDAVGLKQTSSLMSNFKLRGDFEIRLSFELTVWSAPDKGNQSCQFVVKKDDQNFIEISRYKSHLADMYYGNQFVEGNPDLPVTQTSTDVIGEFKIVRQSEIVTTYFYDRVSESYIQLAAYDKYSEDVHVGMIGKSEDKNIEVKFSEFQVVTGNPIIIEPLNPRKEYLIYLSKKPVVDSTGSNTATDKVEEVKVTIDGKQAYVRKLYGIEGLIELETTRVYDEITKQFFVPIVPNEFSTVLVTYRIPRHSTNIRLRKNYFYKVTCVTNEDETDLDLLSPESVKPEKMTYIFEEAVRRNSWMLDQAGERVLLFIKKKAGTVCHCTYRDVKARTHKHPDQDCPTCFGSGFVGGFDGPFAVIIAPLTTEQRVQQTDRGLRLAYQIETWLGPAPIVSQRDMIVRRNGDRCLVGPLTPVEGPGGVRVQQHFVIEVLDGTDIRYKFSIQPLPNRRVQPGVDKSSRTLLRNDLNVATIESPKEREELVTSEDRISHENSNVDHIVKGRSIAFENTNY